MPFSKVASLKINHTLCGGADSANFPVLVSITDATLKTVAHGGAMTSASGYDIVFASDVYNTTRLVYEVESYDGTAGTLIAWVQVPLVSAVTDTVVYLSWGNSAITTYGGSATAVWSAALLAYHFGTASVLSLADSSPYGMTLTNHAGATAAAGEILGAVSLTRASSQWLGATFTPTFPGQISMSAWIRVGTLPASGYATVVGIQPSTFFNVYIRPSGKLAVYALATGGLVGYDDSGSHVLSAGTWYHVAFSYDSTNGIAGYVNGAVDNTGSPLGTLVSAGSLTVNVGDDPQFSPRFWDGRIDEVHVWPTARPQSWFVAEYNNQSAPGAFIAFALVPDPFQVIVREADLSGIFSLVDRTDRFYSDGAVSVSLPRGSRGTAQLQAYDYQPQPGWVCYIYQAGVCIFFGKTMTPTITWIDNLHFWCQCQVAGPEQVMDLLRVEPQIFTNYGIDTWGSIFSNLMGQFAGLPFTVGAVASGGVTTAPVPFLGYVTLTEAVTTIQSLSGLIVYIDYATATINLVASTALAAPWDLANGPDLLWLTPRVGLDAKDYRNRQIVNIDATQIAPSAYVAAAPSSAAIVYLFSTHYPIAAGVDGSMNNGSQATCTGTFTGQPNPGDTVTIQSNGVGVPYTFVATLDNTAYRQVKIGGTAQASYSNLSDAINCVPSGRGVEFSWPTMENEVVSARPVPLLGNNIEIDTKVPGLVGATAYASAAHFSWGTMGTGVVGANQIPLSVGVGPPGTYDIVYIPGTTQCALLYAGTIPSVLPPMQLVFRYHRMDGSAIVGQDDSQVSDRANLEGGSGVYAQAFNAPTGTTIDQAVQIMQQALSQYGTIQSALQYQTYRAGLIPGMVQTVQPLTCPAAFCSVVNPPAVVLGARDYLVQQVSAKLVLAMPATEHRSWFLWTIDLIYVPAAQNAIQTYELMRR